MKDAITEIFNRIRPRLQGIAYRMLGSIVEAEETVQDAGLHWHAADTHGLGNIEPACLQLVRSAKEQLYDRRPRCAIARETQLRLQRNVADAAARGNFHEPKIMLAR